MHAVATIIGVIIIVVTVITLLLLIAQFFLDQWLYCSAKHFSILCSPAHPSNATTILRSSFNYVNRMIIDSND